MLTPYPGTVLYNEIKSGKWGTFNEDLGKLTLHHVTFLPFGYSSFGEIDKMRKFALKKFYFRVNYVLERILSIRTLEDVKRNYQGLRALISV